LSASAPALSLTQASPATLTVRLADPAAAVAYVSLAFALALIFFPVSFPALIVRTSQQGRLIPAIIVFSLLLDAALYIRVAPLLSIKPRLLVASFLGSLPIFIVVGLGVSFENAISQALVEYPYNVSARIAEEILAHTYFTLVSAIFLPFLLIRLVQQFKTRV
jgi:hypothetical protein